MTNEERAVLEEIQKLNLNTEKLWKENASVFEIGKHNRKWKKVMKKIDKLLKEAELKCCVCGIKERGETQSDYFDTDDGYKCHVWCRSELEEK